MPAVAWAMEQGIRRAGGIPDVLPASDGGDGLLDALDGELAGVTEHRVSGPLGQPLTVPVGWLSGEMAVVESRLACGLSLLAPEDRDPLRTTTRGVGELILAVVSQGARQVIIGLGGSATVDGGVGMARAWGWMPHGNGAAVLPDCGGALAGLEWFTAGARPMTEIVALADVRNPLTGPKGARVFAVQKGATPQAEEQLSRGLDRLAAIAAREGHGELTDHPGAGAAGGLGFGLLYFAGAVLLEGARWMLERRAFRARLGGASLVIATEGSFDATSLAGKLTGEVLAQARAVGVPAAVVAPRASAIPAGVLVESGGTAWTAADLAHRIQHVVERALRTTRGP